MILLQNFGGDACSGHDKSDNVCTTIHAVNRKLCNHVGGDIDISIILKMNIGSVWWETLQI
jgi:hypothetical protein